MREKKNLIIRKKTELNILLVLVLVFSVGIGCKNLVNNQDENKPTVERTKDSDDTKSDDTKSDDTKSDDDDKADTKEVEKADASTGELPSEPQLQELARETMLDFSQAIQDEDFSDFYDKLSKAWQKETSPEDLKKGFSVFIDKKTDFSQIKNLEADMKGTPIIKRELGYKMLNMSGTYDTSPLPTKFDVKYIPEGTTWKLSYIRVSTKP